MTMTVLPWTIACLALALAAPARSVAAAPPDRAAVEETIVVDASAALHPFPHYWEQMFGSGRAVLAMRASYRSDLRDTKHATDLQYVRFHGIFDDEVGVYGETPGGKARYDFSYVDQIYDGLLAEGVRPFVELSFMPSKLAAKQILHAFWYRPVVAPPKSYARWDALITAFAEHLIERYGVDEVGRWYFEVWNEPNLDFWRGVPAQATYWTLYDHTARALKAVSPRIRVGGPATAQAAWVGAFIDHATKERVPLDFVSSHAYGNDDGKRIFGISDKIPRSEMVCRAVRKVHDEIRASAQPLLPLIWSEFNAGFDNNPDVTDAAYMGPWLATTISQCDGLAQMMSYWTFSDVFEEQGVIKKPLYGGFGLLAEGGIPKPAFNAFRMLHRLGGQRLTLASPSALATRRADGSIAVAVWNYSPPRAPGEPKSVTIRFRGITASSATVTELDPVHGDLHPAYAQMGSPLYPTPEQVRTLRAAAQLPAGRSVALIGDVLTVELPAYGLALIELPAPSLR